MQTVRPIRDMILLKPEPLEEMVGLIHVPKTATAKHMIAKVLAVGPGRVTDRGVRVEPEVRKGDRVLVREFNMAQKVARVGNDDTCLVPEMDIDAVIES